MADVVKRFSPFFLQKFPGANRDEIIDRNLLAIQQALDDANATIVRQSTTINRLIQTVNVTTTTTTQVTSPPGFGVDEPDDTGGLPGGAAGGLAQAKYWLSVNNPSLPYAVNMGALGAGVLTQTVSGGTAVPASYTTSVNRILLGTAAGGVTDSSLATWDGTRAGFGTASPLAQSVGHFYRSNDGQADLIVANDNVGTAAQMAVRLTRGTGTSTDSLLFALLGTNFAGGGFVVAKSALFELEDAGNFITSVYGAGDIVFCTTTGRTERMRIANGGNVSVANLAGVGNRMVRASAAGVLGIAVAGTDYEGPVSWPLAKRVMFSTGSGPSGNAAFQWDDATRYLFLGAGTSQAWANLGNFGDANTEYVESAWSANVWILKSKKTGAGTVRAMTIDADTATLTARANSVDVSGTTGVQIGYLAGVLSTPAVLVGGTTSVTIAAGTGTHPSQSFSGSQILIDASVALSAGFPAGSTWNGLQVNGTATVPGAGTITAAFGATKFNAPTISGTGVGATVNEAATVLITGAPIASGLSINLSVGLWSQAAVRFDSDLILPTVANGAVATALTSVGPVGSHTTVQKWFAIKDTSGTTYYVPGF